MLRMSTFNDALKSEIARMTRKILKAELQALKKASATHRSDIAALKRENKELRSLLKAQGKTARADIPTPDSAAALSKPTRKRGFGPDQFAALRSKLGISRADMAKLLKASELSVARWETGKATPRAAQLERIAAIRGMGKREASRKLAQSQ